MRRSVMAGETFKRRCAASLRSVALNRFARLALSAASRSSVSLDALTIRASITEIPRITAAWTR